MIVPAEGEFRLDQEADTARLGAAIAAGLGEAIRLHHLGHFCVIKLRKLRFDFSAKRHHSRLRLRRQLLEMIFLHHAVNIRRLFVP